MVEAARLHFQNTFQYSRSELYAYHARDGALERLTPHWEKATVLRKKGGIDPGGEVDLQIRMGMFSFTWVASHVENEPGIMFRDIMKSGPFSSWSHTHRFFDHGADGSLLDDTLEYRLPLHRYLPEFIKDNIADRLRRTFYSRARVIAADLALHEKYAYPPKRILISGASGMLGQALVPLLTTGGHDVWKLVRRKPDAEKKEIFWDPQNGQLEDISEFDAVIHLAGEAIGLGRWSDRRKKKVFESRIKGTELIAQAIVKAKESGKGGPSVFLSASAIGFYGDSGNARVDEQSPRGTGYMPDVCEVWERATAKAAAAGIRTVLLRMGVVLSPQSGALHKLLMASPLGVVKGFGKGEQIISWISLDDTISAIYHAVGCEQLSGPVNLVAPHPVKNTVFCREVAGISGRPLLFRLPAWLLKAIYGQMAEEILLAGTDVDSSKLSGSGYRFRHATLVEALRDMFGNYDLSDMKYMEAQR